MMNQYHWQKTYGSTLPPQGTDVFVCVNGKVDVAWLDDGANGVQCFVGQIFGYDLDQVDAWLSIPPLEKMFTIADLKRNLEESAKSSNTELVNPETREYLIYSKYLADKTDSGYRIAKLHCNSFGEMYFVGDDLNIELDSVDNWYFTPPPFQTLHKEDFNLFTFFLEH
jgi:hypothetical protein